MIEQLITSLKSEVGGQILKQTKLPSGSLDKVFSVIGDVTKKEVTNQMTSGNIGDVMSLFSNKPNNSGANLLQNSIASGVVTNLTKKLGISMEMSDTIAKIAVPALIGLISKKNSATPDDDASPLNELFGNKKSSLTGGLLKNVLGKIIKK